MHDVNFFHEYRIIVKRKRSDRLIRSIAVCLAAGLALGTYLGNEILIGRLSRLETSLTKSLNDPSLLEQHKAAKENEIELLLLLAYESWLVKMDKQIGDYVNTARWADGVFEKVQGSVNIEHISINEGSFSITGYAANEISIASYKSSLDGIPAVIKASIQRVEFTDNLYRFTILGAIDTNKGG
jgi:hypothetical protein